MSNFVFKKVLILSQYYKPESGAPQIRLAKIAEHLKQNGCEVRVLTALPNYPTGKIYEGYSGRKKRKEVIEGVPIIRTWIYAASGKSKIRRLINSKGIKINNDHRFKLERRKYLNLDVGIGAVPSIADLNNDQQPELIISSDSGKIKSFSLMPAYNLDQCGIFQLINGFDQPYRC